MGIHIRRPDEYVRPAGRMLLDDCFRASGEFYASGAYYFQESLSRFPAGQKVEAELVPEPHNPWDARAVACDVDGQRVGYLPAVSAKMWHDVVRAWNRAGFAVYVEATTNRWTTNDDKDRFGLTLPKYDWASLTDLAEAAGLRTAWAAAMSGLTEQQRLLLREDGGYTPDASALRALLRKRSQHPAFQWGTSKDSESLSDRMPFWYGYFVREQMRAEQERLRHARHIRSRLLHTFKDEIARRRQGEREHARDLRREEDRRALELQREGRRVADIAAELGLTHKQAESALSRARDAAGVPATRTQDLQSERRRQAAQAVSLKRSGLARAQIARAMGRSADTVDELLKDGLFHEAPEDHPERLQLARRCVELRAAGLVKEEVLARLGVSRKQALRAFRDASSLPGTG
ncbi:hypothetical protein ACIQ6Y_20260 [Streptomyces sp. NPDC096205]|uniref:hypothetical protein n=1 Tax=Streptomyces sp. NPDC096205 TaxID=3366081 RepID=UPI003810E165